MQNENSTQQSSEAKIQINLSDVSSVYSGRVGACCCGCAGKHSYASAHQAWASKDRGYAVTDDEVSDRSVKLIVGKLQALIDSGELEVHDHRTDGVVSRFVSIDTETRTYIAYFKK